MNKDLNEYRKVSDGWFTYYVNTVTGEKKFELGENDFEIEREETKINMYYKVTAYDQYNRQRYPLPKELIWNATHSICNGWKGLKNIAGLKLQKPDSPCGLNS